MTGMNNQQSKLTLVGCAVGSDEGSEVGGAVGLDEGSEVGVPVVGIC